MSSTAHPRQPRRSAWSCTCCCCCTHGPMWRARCLWACRWALDAQPAAAAQPVLHNVGPGACCTPSPLVDAPAQLILLAHARTQGRDQLDVFVPSIQMRGKVRIVDSKGSVRPPLSGADDEEDGGAAARVSGRRWGGRGEWILMSWTAGWQRVGECGVWRWGMGHEGYRQVVLHKRLQPHMPSFSCCCARPQRREDCPEGLLLRKCSLQS